MFGELTDKELRALRLKFVKSMIAVETEIGNSDLFWEIADLWEDAVREQYERV